jgi:hypothetical protein
MATSFQTSLTGITPVYPLNEAPLPKTAFVDRNGETWIQAGHTSTGELILACPEPSNPDDRGDGSSYPWTLSARADVVERRLVEVDTEFLDMYGPDQAAWKRWQVETYEAAMTRAFAEFGPEQGGVAA